MLKIKRENRFLKGKAAKQALSIMLAGILCGTQLLGCTKNDSVKNSQTQKPFGSLNSFDEQAKKEQELMKDVKIIKFMAGMSGSPSMQAAEIFAKDLQEKFKGEIRVELFKTGELGNQADTMEGVSKGTVEMAVLSPGRLQAYDRRFSAFNQLSVMYDDISKIDRYLDTNEYKEAQKSLVNSGIRVTGMYSSGERQIWTAKKEVLLPSDMKNLKIRVSEQGRADAESSFQVNMYRAYGAETVILPLADVAAGIRSGIIDGLDCISSDIIANRLSQVIRYCTVTNHSMSLNTLILSDKAWKSLTAEQQAVFEDEMKLYEKNIRRIINEQEEEYTKKLKNEGIKFIDLSDYQHEQFRKVIDSAAEASMKTSGIKVPQQ